MNWHFIIVLDTRSPKPKHKKYIFRMSCDISLHILISHFNYTSRDARTCLKTKLIKDFIFMHRSKTLPHTYTVEVLYMNDFNLTTSELLALV